VIAISSKFAIRFRGKHIFNPTNLAIVALMLERPACGSRLVNGARRVLRIPHHMPRRPVVNRASRSDVTYAFMIAWTAVLVGRSLWLGEPMTSRSIASRTARSCFSRSS